MSENLKTIKELADELGVSKQTIHYHIKSLSNIKRDKNNKGAVLLNEEEQKFIYSKVNAVKDDTVKDDTVKGNTAHFLSEIQFLRTQLENKDTQILQMQNLLDQQQRLALQDKKLLEEYKSEINELKALKMPQEDMQEDMKDGSSIRGEAQEEIERLKAQLKLSEEERNKAKEKEPVKTESKKWWQLWK